MSVTLSGRTQTDRLRDARSTLDNALHRLKLRGKRTPCQVDPHMWDAFDEEAGEPFGMAKSRVKAAGWQCYECPLFVQCDNLREVVVAQWDDDTKGRRSGNPVMIGVMAGRMLSGRSVANDKLDDMLTGRDKENAS